MRRVDGGKKTKPKYADQQWDDRKLFTDLSIQLWGEERGICAPSGFQLIRVYQKTIEQQYDKLIGHHLEE